MDKSVCVFVSSITALVWELPLHMTSVDLKRKKKKNPLKNRGLPSDFLEVGDVPLNAVRNSKKVFWFVKLHKIVISET